MLECTVAKFVYRTYSLSPLWILYFDGNSCACCLSLCDSVARDGLPNVQSIHTIDEAY